LLKRKSCYHGCKDCHGLIDHVQDVIAYWEIYDYLPINEKWVDSSREYTVEIDGSEGEEITFVPVKGAKSDV